MRVGLRIVGVGVSMALAAGCGGPGQEGRPASQPGGPPTRPAVTTPVDAPADINQLTVAGELFVVVNPEWWLDRSQPQLLATRDRSEWFRLPDLPEEVSAIGHGAADGRLVVTAIGCEGSAGEDLCHAVDAQELEAASGELSVWVLDDDLGGYQRVELPNDDTTVSVEQLGASSTGTAAVVAVSSGALLVRPDASAVEFPSARLVSGQLVDGSIVGSRIFAVNSSNGLPSPDGPPLGPETQYSYDLTDIRYVEADDPDMEPVVLDVPDDVSSLNAFLTQDAVIWITADEEVVLDVATREVTRAPLPPDILPMASARVNGGAVGVVDPSGTLFLTPPALLASDGSGSTIGIARRDPDGTWDVASEEPAPPGPLVIARGGRLFAVDSPNQISVIAE